MTLENDALRRAWIERPLGISHAVTCPGDDAIWRAVRGESSADQRIAIVDHLERCPACAESWRVASSLCETSQDGRRFARASWARAGVIAASLVVGVAGAYLALREVPTLPTTSREPARVEIRSLLVEHAPLPRDSFTLVWSPGPEGTLYDVEVGTRDLVPIVRAFALEEPRFTVPSAELEAFAAGTEIAWRVQATLPDGRVVASITHINILR